MGHNGPTFAIDWHPEERNWVASAGRDKMVKVASKLSLSLNDKLVIFVEMQTGLMVSALYSGLSSLRCVVFLPGQDTL